MKKVIAITIVIIFILGLIVYFDLNQNKISFNEAKVNIKKTDNNYIEVDNAKDFIKALDNNDIHIINIVKDIDLGYNKVEKNKYIEEHNIPLIHPILKKSGISRLLLKNKNNLIITSSNKSSIYHANIIIENSSNIKIDNIVFKELWEWDEETTAEYDRNEWDNITILNSNKIEISNCNFTKSYDGIIDINNSNNITISNNYLDTIDLKDEFFNKQFEELENNIDKYPMYKYLRKDVSLSIEKIKKLSQYQFKLFLIGTESNCPKNKNIVIHDNKFINVKTRIPQGRNSSIYFYNNYIDSRNIRNDIISMEQVKMINEKYPKFVSLKEHGVISIERSYIVSKNNTFKGIDLPYTNTRDKDYFKIGIIKVINDKIID